MNAEHWKTELGLEPHPEGGYYRQFFASPVTVKTPQGERPTMTAIHYLLEKGDYSAWHRLCSHELWHWHAGGPVVVHCADEDGIASHKLGSHSELTLTIEPNTWFAAEPAPETGFVLVSCTVSPGFDFADFEWGESQALIRDYPEDEALIRRLSR